MQELLEDAGFDVEEIVEAPPGISNTVDIVSFMVEHLDAVLIGVLANVVTAWILRTPVSRSKPTHFSVKDSKKSVIIKVEGDGNWIQVHPRPEQHDE